MEQEVDSGSSLSAELLVGKKFNSYDEMMALLDRLKASNHPLYVFNSQTVDDYNKTETCKI